MGVAQAIEVQADYAIKGRDLRQYYAGFCRRALPEGAVWRLALAASCLPTEHPGYKVWMTKTAGTERFGPDLWDWAIGLGATVATMKPRLKTRRRTFVASYDHAWGRHASIDGLNLAIYGKTQAAVSARAEQFGCDRDAYQRVRDFVAGALLLSEWQFEDALAWAHKVARDS